MVTQGCLIDFKVGETCFTPDGVECEFDHYFTHTNGVRAYVRVGRMIQVTDHSGCDFDEVIEFDGNLVEIDASRLSKKAPVKALQTKVLTLREEISQLERTIKTKNQEVLNAEHANKITQKEADNLMQEYPAFKQLHELAQGQTKFIVAQGPSKLSAPTKINSAYPSFPVLTLIRSGSRFIWSANIKTRYGTSETREHRIFLFDTEQEQLDHVSTLYAEILEGFRDNPKRYEAYGSSVNTGPRHSTVLNWVQEWKHLSIPSWVAGDIEEFESEQRALKLKLARQAVANMEGNLL